MKRKAFTLAEVMIALVVFGVICGIVYPVLVNRQPDKTAILIKRAYYTTETIVAELINDARLFPGNFDNTFPTKFTAKLNAKADLSNNKVTGTDGIKWDFTQCNFPTCTLQIDVGTGKPDSTFSITIYNTGKMEIQNPTNPNQEFAIKAIQMSNYK